MKKLLLNSMLFLLLIQCASHKKGNYTHNEANSVGDTIKKTNSDFKELEIKHGAPNQDKIDKIKEKKTKNKKQTLKK